MVTKIASRISVPRMGARSFRRTAACQQYQLAKMTTGIVLIGPRSVSVTGMPVICTPLVRCRVVSAQQADRQQVAEMRILVAGIGQKQASAARILPTCVPIARSLANFAMLETRTVAVVLLVVVLALHLEAATVWRVVALLACSDVAQVTQSMDVSKHPTLRPRAGLAQALPLEAVVPGQLQGRIIQLQQEATRSRSFRTICIGGTRLGRILLRASGSPRTSKIICGPMFWVCRNVTIPRLSNSELDTCLHQVSQERRGFL